MTFPLNRGDTVFGSTGRGIASAQIKLPDGLMWVSSIHLDQVDENLRLEQIEELIPKQVTGCHCLNGGMGSIW